MDIQDPLIVGGAVAIALGAIEALKLGLARMGTKTEVENGKRYTAHELKEAVNQAKWRETVSRLLLEQQEMQSKSLELQSHVIDCLDKITNALEDFNGHGAGEWDK